MDENGRLVDKNKSQNNKKVQEPDQNKARMKMGDLWIGD